MDKLKITEIDLKVLPRPGSLMENWRLPVSPRNTTMIENMLTRSRSPRSPWHCSDGQQRVKATPTSKSLILPATPTTPHWLPLTNLDRLVNPIFISVIFFYENVLVPESGSMAKRFREVTTTLKESLAKVLVEFYPLAGRLALNLEEDESGKVDIHCNDAGAIFIEAAMNVDLSELGGPQPMPMLSGMDAVRPGPGRLYLPDQITPMPVLIVQVTQFTCGSIAVAANWHHTVADAFSGCHFMRSWAEMASGVELGLKPCHDRLLLEPRNPPIPFNGTGYSCGAAAAPHQVPAPRALRPRDLDNQATAVHPFVFKKERVQKLKETLSKSSNSGSQFTSAESISAELWRLMTRARSEDSEDCEAKSRFFMFVDGRKRLGLPPGYFGNVVGSACAVTTTRELLANPISYAATLIRTATRSINADHFRALIDWVEIEKSMSRTISTCRSDHLQSTGNDVAATFWTFFPIYEINFGWGKPVLSVRNAPPRPTVDGVAIMPGPVGSGNFVALLNLQSDRMLRLERDPEFRRASFQPLSMAACN